MTSSAFYHLQDLPWEGTRTWTHLLPQIYQQYIYKWNSSHRTPYWTKEDLKHLKGKERSPHNQVGMKGKWNKQKDRICIPGRQFGKEKVPVPEEALSLAGRLVNIDRKFQRREQQLFVVGKNREMYKWSLPPPCKPQLGDGCVHWYRPGLGAGTQDLEDRPRERTVIGCAETAKRGWRWWATTRGVHGRNPEPPQKQSPIVKWCVKEGGAVITASFLQAPVPATMWTPENLPQPPLWGHFCLCGLSHPSCHLSQLWEQMPVRLPTHRGEAETTGEPQEPHDLKKQGLKSLPEGCKFILPTPAL